MRLRRRRPRLIALTVVSTGRACCALWAEGAREGASPPAIRSSRGPRPPTVAFVVMVSMAHHRARLSCQRRLLPRVMPMRRSDSQVMVGRFDLGPARMRRPVRSPMPLSWHHSLNVRTSSSFVVGSQLGEPAQLVALRRVFKRHNSKPRIDPRDVLRRGVAVGGSKMKISGARNGQLVSNCPSDEHVSVRESTGTQKNADRRSSISIEIAENMAASRRRNGARH